MRVAWGIKGRKVLTGAHLCVRTFQIASLLPLPYIFAVAGYPAVVTGRSILTYLFDAGIMAIPRLEAVALSLLYRATMSEVVVYFALLVPAAIVGFAFERLLRDEGPAAITVRRAMAACIAADLIIRLLPFGFNTAFGLPMAAIGFACQAACLIFIVLDLRNAHTGR